MTTVSDLYKNLKGAISTEIVSIIASDWTLKIAAGEMFNSMKPVVDNELIFIPVYVSQWTPNDSDARRNDCGPTCAAMHLRARGDNAPVNALRTADPTGLTNAPQLQEMLRLHGLSSTIEQTDYALPLSAIAPYSILLINYTPLRQYAQDSAFTGWHWLIIVGPDPANPNNTLTLDPDYSRTRINEGDHKSYPTDALRSAFRPYSSNGTCTSLRVDDVPLTILPNLPYFVIIATSTGYALNVRSGPGTNFPVVGSVQSGARIAVTDAQDGWLKLADKQFIASAWTKRA